MGKIGSIHFHLQQTPKNQHTLQIDQTHMPTQNLNSQLSLLHQEVAHLIVTQFTSAEQVFYFNRADSESIYSS